jgi:hypothetical protein
MENEEQQSQETETPDAGIESKDEGQETDWKAEALKYKAIADRKEKKLAELKSSLDEKKPQETLTNKSEGLTREEVIFFTKGYEEDDYKIAKIIAKEKKVSLMEATKDDYFQAVLEKRKQKEEDKKASLPPSNATGFTPSKPIGQMTREEHMAFVREQVAKAMNG